VHGDLLPVTKLAYEHGLRITDMTMWSLLLFGTRRMTRLASGYCCCSVLLVHAVVSA
jgi:hypothetical protein